ncbi:Gfo/Idh/MocA family oxidoreductase [Yersinia enterocolitica]|nr:Gfo/Idh/MocA family oxidoreductase [Yersinia enterocolitica]NQT44851.1 Gfo/Idh/MocA family oxidoreductase [Yersinia enterocolitica]NQT99340.1 Gfo/Idh/MocA family oxidoreductase [Yersinia enterocolitica]
MKTIGVIGLGNIARRHRQNLKKLFPCAIIYAMSASGQNSTENVENADEIVRCIDELIKMSPDFVIIASPATKHAEHAIDLIEARIPILIEKPISADILDCEKILKALLTSPTPVAIGYCLRYMPSAIIVKGLLDNNDIGVVYNINSTVGQYLPQWRPNSDYINSVSAKKVLGGGVLLELSHELDYIQWLLGDLTINYACLRNSESLNLEVEEIADLLLTSPNGTLCSVHLDFLQKKASRRCTFIGDSGSIEWDLMKNSVIKYDELGCHTIYSEPMWDKNHMYLSMLQDFAQAIKSKQLPDYAAIRNAIKIVNLVSDIKKKAVWGVKQ